MFLPWAQPLPSHADQIKRRHVRGPRIKKEGFKLISWIDDRNSEHLAGRTVELPCTQSSKAERRVLRLLTLKISLITKLLGDWWSYLNNTLSQEQQKIFEVHDKCLEGFSLSESWLWCVWYSPTVCPSWGKSKMWKAIPLRPCFARLSTEFRVQTLGKQGRYLTGNKIENKKETLIKCDIFSW